MLISKHLLRDQAGGFPRGDDGAEMPARALKPTRISFIPLRFAAKEKKRELSSISVLNDALHRSPASAPRLRSGPEKKGKRGGKKENTPPVAAPKFSLVVL